MAATTTTIKVPTDLRDRINRDARSSGISAAKLLERLLDEHERQQRFAAVRRAYAALPADDDYATESAEWAEAETDWPDD